MKKLILLLLALTMILSLAACGGGSSTGTPSNENTTPATDAQQEDVSTEEPEQDEELAEPEKNLVLGETASTDLAEFTLESSQFTYYVSNYSGNHYEPMEEANSMYAASIGHCYVSLTFTITNKDRGGSISYAGSFADWEPNWTVSYNGTDYSVKGFDLNDNSGSYSIDLAYSAVMNRDTGDIISDYNLDSYLLFAGETVTLRTFGVIDMEPENLTDGYEFTVGVLNSSGEYEYFTYTISQR